jgi:nitrate reductase delta subunit
MAGLTMSEYENALRSRDGARGRELPGIGSRKSSQRGQALERVRTWTRERFKLGGDVPILVAEIACGLPGCPPLETVVAFWTAGDKRHQFKLFKPVREVVRDDLPYGWLIDALVASEMPDCC